MKYYFTLLVIFTIQSSRSQHIDYYDVYNQTFFDKIDSFFYNKSAKEIMYVTTVFSSKKILKGEYMESDEMISDISIENQGQKFNYNLYSIFVFEDSKKSFEFKKYVIEDKSIEKEWSKLVFKELNDENKVYDCFEKKFDNITYSRDIGVGNKVIIQKDDDNFKLTIIGNDCEILEVIPLNKNSKVFESESLICFYDNIIYLFVFSDL